MRWWWYDLFFPRSHRKTENRSCGWKAAQLTQEKQDMGIWETVRLVRNAESLSGKRCRQRNLSSWPNNFPVGVFCQGQSQSAHSERWMPTGSPQLCPQEQEVEVGLPLKNSWRSLVPKGEDPHHTGEIHKLLRLLQQKKKKK